MQIRRQGLSLVELLMVTLSVAVIVVIAIKKVGGRRSVETIGALQTDVRNAKVAEARYFAAHNAYATLAQLDSAHLFSPIPGHVVTITPAAAGFTVTSNNGSDPLTCSLTYNSAAANDVPAKPDCH